MTFLSSVFLGKRGVKKGRDFKGHFLTFTMQRKHLIDMQ